MIASLVWGLVRSLVTISSKPEVPTLLHLQHVGPLSIYSTSFRFVRSVRRQSYLEGASQSFRSCPNCRYHTINNNHPSRNHRQSKVLLTTHTLAALAINYCLIMRRFPLYPTPKSHSFLSFKLPSASLSLSPSKVRSSLPPKPNPLHSKFQFPIAIIIYFFRT